MQLNSEVILVKLKEVIVRHWSVGGKDAWM